MADDFLGICAWAKYGPSVNGATFATYLTTGGGVGNIYESSVAVPMVNQGFLQDWTSISIGGATAADIAIIEGLGPTGRAINVSGGSSSASSIRRSLTTNYARLKFGISFMTNLLADVGIRFLDAGTVQCTLGCDTSGRITLWRGSIGGTVIAQTGALIISSVRHFLEFDLTFHNSTGAYEVRMDGVAAPILSGSGADLCSNANNFVNQFELIVGSSSGALGRGGFGGLYWRDNTGGTAPWLGDVEVDCLVANGDDATSDFSAAASVLGPWYAQQNNLTNAPGAGQLVLVPVTPEVNMTVNSIGIMPRATSAGAKFKGVIYADSSNSPNGALLSSGTEVTGAVSGTALSLPLVTPQALIGGTQYWIGYITDTSVAIQLSDNYSATGQRKANTYASGAPNPGGAGFTTAQSPWCIWGHCTGAAAEWPTVANVPSALIGGTIAYNQSATVGHKSYYDFEAMPVAPTDIFAVAVSTLWNRSDAGARTANINIKSGGSETNGSVSGITPATTPAYSQTITVQDPATSAAWTEAGVNAAKAGVEIVT